MIIGVSIFLLQDPRLLLILTLASAPGHERIHTGDRPFACLGCHKSYKRVDARYRHWVAKPICYTLDMAIMGNTAEGIRRKRRMKNLLAKNGFSRLAIAAAIEF